MSFCCQKWVSWNDGGYTFYETRIPNRRTWMKAGVWVESDIRTGRAPVCDWITTSRQRWAGSHFTWFALKALLSLVSCKRVSVVGWNSPINIRKIVNSSTQWMNTRIIGRDETSQREGKSRWDDLVGATWFLYWVTSELAEKFVDWTEYHMDRLLSGNFKLESSGRCDSVPSDVYERLPVPTKRDISTFSNQRSKFSHRL